MELGLYVHVPFCAARCRYCDFYSTVDAQGIPDFVELVIAELRLRTPPGARWRTVYVGGGTPSQLPPADLAALLDAVRAAGTLLPDAEVTVEVNPGTLGRGQLRELRAAGFDRLSIGCQSFDDGDLAFLSRIHSAADARAAVEDARAAGFENLSLDLIHGLPGRTVAHWRRQLRAAVGLAPEHLSCYGLSVEPGTPLAAAVARGEVRMPSEALGRRLYLETDDLLGALGYPRYEVSSHARALRFRSQHNLGYWRRKPYLGLGPSAHSFDGTTRRWNPASLVEWREALARGVPATEGEERLTPAEAALEDLMLGLRMSDGVDLRAFAAAHGYALEDVARATVGALVAGGLAEVADGHLRLTRSGMVLGDAVVRGFDLPES